jgi:hypothetical protein
LLLSPIITNSVYLLDALATTTNTFPCAQNFSPSDHPSSQHLSRSAGLLHLSMRRAIRAMPLTPVGSSTARAICSLWSPTATRLTRLKSICFRRAPAGRFHTTSPTLPGRVEIIGDEVNLEEARIRSESAVIIKAKNLVGNSIAQIDSPRVNFDVRSTQPVLVVSNIAPATVKRFGGTVRAWSAVWDNYEVSNTGTNIDNQCGGDLPRADRGEQSPVRRPCHGQRVCCARNQLGLWRQF